MRWSNGFFSETSNTIQEEVWHLVLTNTYVSLIPDQPFKYNVDEVTALGFGGSPLSSYKRAYFPVHIVQSWRNMHFEVYRRRKLVL
jgi:hypothetical protein